MVGSPTLASRSLRFDLDATNKYFAWKFEGYTVADNFQITYVSPANEHQQSWNTGRSVMMQECNNVTISPKTWSGSYMNKYFAKSICLCRRRLFEDKT
jgi:hypothetical protein